MSRLCVLFLTTALFATTSAAAQPPRESVAEVSAITSFSGEAPLPIVGEGAPNLSVEQMAAVACEAERNRAPSDQMSLIRAAQRATLAARQSRIDFKQELIDRARLEQVELARQAAVNKVIAREGSDTLGVVWENLTIDNLRYSRVLEHGRPALRVEGEVRNTTSGTHPFPAINILAMDARGFILAAQSSLPDQAPIAAGEARAFEIHFRNPPDYTVRLRAAFGPPLLRRNFRGCESMAPTQFDPRSSDARPKAALANAPAARRTPAEAPTYDLPELAAIARLAAEDAEGVIATRLECSRLRSWQDLLRLSERAEEAWLATAAAQEMHRDGARGVFTAEEIQAAEAARTAAVQAMIAAVPTSAADRPLTAGRYRQSGLETRRSGGDMFVIQGSFTTPDDFEFAAGRPVPPLPIRVIVRDRKGLVISDAVRPANRVTPLRYNVSLRLPRDFEPGRIEVGEAC